MHHGVRVDLLSEHTVWPSNFPLSPQFIRRTPQPFDLAFDAKLFDIFAELTVVFTLQMFRYSMNGVDLSKFVFQTFASFVSRGTSQWRREKHPLKVDLKKTICRCTHPACCAYQLNLFSVTSGHFYCHWARFCSITELENEFFVNFLFVVEHCNTWRLPKPKYESTVF